MELARALVKERRYEEALVSLQDADEDSALSVALAAECHWSLGRTEEAKRKIDESNEGVTHRDIALIDARIKIDSGDHSAAIGQLTALLENDPHDVAVRFQLAQAYRGLGDTDKYSEELEEVQASQSLRQRLTKLNTEAILKPLDASIRDELAETCELLGKPELAEMWRQAAQACRDMSGSVPDS